MMRSKVYLALQAVVCIALVILLSVSAVEIYQEGSARKAKDPMENIYTPEAAAGKFAPIAPLFFAGLGLMIAGLVLGVKDKNAEKPVKDSELSRDLIVARVAQPSTEMTAEQKCQKRLQWLGWGLFSLCIVPVFVYLLNPAHFPEADPEGMFCGLLRVFLPWTIAGLGVLAVTSVLCERSILRETSAAQKQQKAEKPKICGKTENPPAKKGKLQVILLVAAIVLIIAGVLNGSALDVLYKAITICTECVGLG